MCGSRITTPTLQAVDLPRNNGHSDLVSSLTWRARGLHNLPQRSHWFSYFSATAPFPETTSVRGHSATARRKARATRHRRRRGRLFARLDDEYGDAPQVDVP